MHRMNDLDLWRQRRREMLHEAEGEHLARRLRATRPKKAAWIRSTLLGRVHGRALEDARCA